MLSTNLYVKFTPYGFYDNGDFLGAGAAAHPKAPINIVKNVSASITGHHGHRICSENYEKANGLPGRENRESVPDGRCGYRV